MQQFLEALHSADLYVVSGMGALNDVFTRAALTILDTAALALRARAIAVAFGQGLGPFSEGSRVLLRCRQVLPRFAFVAVREGLTGPGILLSLGVPPEKILITGDDAIELAYELRPRDLGCALGINLRIAPYSALGTSFLNVARDVLGRLQSRLGAPVLPVPISQTPLSSDARTLAELLGPSTCGSELVTPESVIRQVGRCRLVLAGSYHAAVFALAQGVPVVAVAATQYYQDKFLGLRQQFPVGCRVLLAHDHQDLRGTLEAALLESWESAPHWRQGLLLTASRQIERSRAAYERLRAVVERSARHRDLPNPPATHAF